MREPTQIIDISQPVDIHTACFPVDVPFSREITVSYADSCVLNLCAMTMSPHVGTHADAAGHLRGDLQQNEETIGQAGLSPFVGPCVVIDVSPCTSAIEPAHITEKLHQLGMVPPRLLFKTRTQVRYNVWESDYAWFSEALVHSLGEKGVKLIGLDTPSVDAVDSKSLPAHHALIQHNMSWLENLDLTVAPEGMYFLVALPLKLSEMEASPVRAALLTLS